MMRFLGITRERVFSPGRVADDSAILEMVADCLRALGQAVTMVSGDEGTWPEPSNSTLVFAMCQGAPALQRLHDWEAKGVQVVNSTQGILNCQRHRTVAALTAASTPFPDSVVIQTRSVPTLPPWIAASGAWIKRGDVHATEADDVVRVNDEAAALDALRRFASRGIPQAVVQRHVPGAVLKFYAVRGRFFHCVCPPGVRALAPDLLRRIDAVGQDAARVLNLEVYGGDCISGVNGALTLIDLNDWPSYAPCRAEAATEIAAHLLAQKRCE